MSQKRPEASWQRIIRATTEIIEDTEQMMRDILSWNDNTRERVAPGYPPMDVEPCRVTIAKARQIRQLAIDRQPIPGDLFAELIAASESPLM